VALTEQRERGEAIAEATRLEDEHQQDEEQEHLRQLRQPCVDVSIVCYWM
jgi:hypothetical protein